MEFVLTANGRVGRVIASSDDYYPNQRAIDERYRQEQLERQNMKDRCRQIAQQVINAHGSSDEFDENRPYRMLLEYDDGRDITTYPNCEGIITIDAFWNEQHNFMKQNIPLDGTTKVYIEDGYGNELPCVYIVETETMIYDAPIGDIFYSEEPKEKYYVRIAEERKKLKTASQ
jgi:hypothetical protein